MLKQNDNYRTQNTYENTDENQLHAAMKKQTQIFILRLRLRTTFYDLWII